MRVINYTSNKKPMACVYIIKNNANNKIYVGSTGNVKTRLSTYRYEIKNQKLKSHKLLNSINKYGFENFEFQIIATAPVEYLIKIEQYLINTLKPELNIRKVADSNRGIKRNEEWIERNRQKAIKENRERQRAGIITYPRKLNHLIVSEIKKDITTSMKRKDIAKKYNVSYNLIWQIQNNKIWHTAI